MRYLLNTILLSVAGVAVVGCPAGQVLSFGMSSEAELPPFRPGDSYQVNLVKTADALGAVVEGAVHHTSSLVTEVRRDDARLEVASLFVVTANPRFEAFEVGATYRLDVELTGILDAPVDGGGTPAAPMPVSSPAVSEGPA